MFETYIQKHVNVNNPHTHMLVTKSKAWLHFDANQPKDIQSVLYAPEINLVIICINYTIQKNCFVENS